VLVPSIGAVADGQVTLRSLLRFHVNGADQFVEIVSALLNREDILVARLGGIGKMQEWVVDVRALESILGSMASGKRSDLSVTQPSKDLGVEQEVAYALVRHGLIKSRRVVIGKRPSQVVRHGAVAAFRRQYVLGVDLATSLGMSPKAALRYLGDRDIHPVAGPTLAERLCRQYVWRRTKKLAALVERSQHTNIGRKRNAT
jgi:hypothetical protein